MDQIKASAISLARKDLEFFAGTPTFVQKAKERFKKFVILRIFLVFLIDPKASPISIPDSESSPSKAPDPPAVVEEKVAPKSKLLDR